MIQNDDDAIKCPSSTPCAETIGRDVQNVSLVRNGSTSITVLDYSLLSASVGDFFRIAGDVYQITGIFANGVFEIHTPFSGGFTDVTVGFYAPRPTECIKATDSASDMDLYLERRGDEGHISHDAGTDLFEVAKVTLNPGVSWAVTFKHEIFQDAV